MNARDPKPGRVRTITFVPLFSEAEDQHAALWLREVANPEAGVPARAAIMPRSGIGFFEATGEAARQLDLVWSQAVPSDTAVVVVTLHHPALPEFLEGVDASFVVGMRGGDRAGVYTRFANVQVVDSADPRQVFLAAARAWNDPQDPAFRLPEEPRSEAGAQSLELEPEAEPEPGPEREPEAEAGLRLEPPEPDSDFFDEIFGERPPTPRPEPVDVFPEPWGPLSDPGGTADQPQPEQTAPDPTGAPASEPARIPEDPLAALAAL
ncbi:MAG: hypothetical protein J2P38_05730, partial [Candidatus Dormibacteraeota bacterium]|nr:hypothetical protein [Candidatus Dormibacteraeota bacterium]